MAGFAEMPQFDPTRDENDVLVPSLALCLKMPADELGSEDMVVHREDREDFVYLFESLDDAYACADAARETLGFTPRVARVRVGELRFRMARFKPAVGEQKDISLRHLH